MSKILDVSNTNYTTVVQPSGFIALDTGGTGNVVVDGNLIVTGSVISSTGEVNYCDLQGVQGISGGGGPGTQGIQGISGGFGGAAFDYFYSTNVANSDPTTGYLKFNNIDLSLVTTLYISTTDHNLISTTNFLQTIDDSTSAIKGHFSIMDESDPSTYLMFAITGLHTEYAGYFSVPVSYISGSTSLINDLDVIITFARTGDIGSAGVQGVQGIDGAAISHLPYDIAFYIATTPYDINSIVTGFLSPRYVLMSTAFTNIATCGVAATAIATTFILKQNGVQKATILFNVGVTTGIITFTAGSTIAVVEGDIMTIGTSSTVDSNIAEIGITFVGNGSTNGVTYLQGIQGLNGLYAAQGIQGIRGIQGLTGLQGLLGLQGVQGLNVPIATPTVVGTVFGYTTSTNTSIGYNAGNTTMTGTNNVAVGNGALLCNTTGSSNVAIGIQALKCNTTGIHNIAQGYRALVNNTTGYNNNAQGYLALRCNTTGIGNVANGYAALSNNTTGATNIAVGYYALSQNISGSENIAIGAGAMRSSTAGCWNTAIGAGALWYNTTGGDNIAIGTYALTNNVSGSRNIATGCCALKTNTTGSCNIASGQRALEFNVSGYHNIATGYMALNKNISGYQNIAQGYRASTCSTTGSNNIAIGTCAGFALTTGSNNTIIGSLLGTSNLNNTLLLGAGATERLKIDSSGLYVNGSLVDNTSGGIYWQSVQTIGFLAAGGKGYPVDTTISSITAILPAIPTVGNIVIFIDYAGTFTLNNLIISPNGNNIKGSNSDLIISVSDRSIGLVYIDSIRGWIPYTGY
jgi:hypothetical protein